MILRGFLLLPNPPEDGIPCRYVGVAINEYGDVFGEYFVNADYASWRYFFWTEADPLQINLTPVGEACEDAGMAMSDAFFGSYVVAGANVNNGLNWKLYSYSVAGGTFSYSLYTQFTAVQLGGMNSNHLLPLIAKTVNKRVTTYNVCIYNPATRQTTLIAPSDWRGVGSMNDAGDVVFNGPDGAMRLYRNQEKTAYKIYDLLDEAGKSQFSEATSIATKRAQVNDSNVGIVPQTDPFDHIAGYALFTINGKSYPRGFVLTPVAK